MKTMSGKTSSLPPPSLPLASHSIPQASPLLSLLHLTSSRFFPLLLSPPPVSSHSSFSISPFLLSFLLPLNLSPHPYLVSLSLPPFPPFHPTGLSRFLRSFPFSFTFYSLLSLFRYPLTVLSSEPYLPLPSSYPIFPFPCLSGHPSPMASLPHLPSTAGGVAGVRKVMSASPLPLL